jgi:signal peptidase I
MRLRLVLEMGATIVVALVWFVALRPVALGGPASYIVVKGYSMSGTLAPGDLVVTRAQAGYAVGDTIVYRVPAGAGRGLLVVHRIVTADPSGYRMQGDANSHQDPWRPKLSDVVGRLVVTLPGFGGILVSLANPFVLGISWALVALVTGLSFLPESPGPRPQVPTNPGLPNRPGPRSSSTIAAATSLGVSLLVGLVVMSAVDVLYPAWDLSGALLSAAAAMAVLILGLFFLPDSSVLSLRSMLGVKPRRRRRTGHPDAAAALAAGVMVGLVMLSAVVVVSPAHATGLTIHNQLITARVTHCSPPPPVGGQCT